MMDMFVHNDQLAQLEAALPHSTGAVRLDLLLNLAAALCQRNTERALLLADEAQSLIDPAARPETNARIMARVQLIHAEALWLNTRVDAAAVLAQEALQGLVLAKDQTSQIYARWLLGWINNDLGRLSQRDADWQAAFEVAQDVPDTARAETILAVMALMDTLLDAPAAERRWGERFDMEQGGWPAQLWTWVANFWGVMSALLNDFETAAAYFTQSYETALETGQLRRAIGSALKVGATFTKLNDFHSALDWMYRALDLARSTGWPGSIGHALTKTSDVLRRLEQLELAGQLLLEALSCLQPISASRDYATALQQLAELEFDRGQYESALELFIQLQQRGIALNSNNFQFEAQRGQAQALLHLGGGLRALEMARNCLQLAQEHQNQHEQIVACQVLAEVCAVVNGPVPDEWKPAPSPSLYYLKRARALALKIPGYTLADSLLDAIANAYAAVGQYKNAFRYAREANMAREKVHSMDTAQYAMVMQVRQHTDRIHAQAEHHRQLAATEAKRAVILQQSSNHLAQLDLIGREITAHLDETAVFDVLGRHVSNLLDVNAFMVYLVSKDGRWLDRAFGFEIGDLLPAARIDFMQPDSEVARCLRDQCEIVQDFCYVESQVEPGTGLNRSALYAPLTLGDRVLGVMGVLSTGRQVYDERQCLIFRTLSAYAAIALDNAHAYRHLQETQALLVEQEKLAALGSLVAGVAHELNTPIGNGLMMASSVQDKIKLVRPQLEGQTLRRTDLEFFMRDIRESWYLIMQGLISVADLINSFKQVAVDRTSAQQRRFNLQKTCHEIGATLASHIRHSGHKLVQDIPENIELLSYPGPFGQVVTNLINNALLHAFDGRLNGLMRMTAREAPNQRVLFEFHDDGVGIPEQHIKRIFDPFFTTKLGQGGSGLGLNISYNIVTKLLGGQIVVQSAPMQGTCFLIDLPLISPQSENQPND